MFALLCSLIRLLVLPGSAREIALENLALRQQLVVFKRRCPQPRLRRADRLFWLCLSRTWKNWRQALIIVRPETVVSWHRQGFRLFWTWVSRRKCSGRPETSSAIRALVRKLAAANPWWGAPRIHGELLKLGIQISERSVSRLLPKHRKPPSQSWKTFLENHADELVSMDFFTVPTATFRVLFVLVVLAHRRRSVTHFNVTEHPTAAWVAQQLREAFPDDRAPRYLTRDRDRAYGERFRDRAGEMGITEVLTAAQSPWQNAFVERLIGSIRRECLDHVIVLGEKHLRKILRSYFEYYQESRTHLSLGKDPPSTRAVQPPEAGVVVEIAQVGGLHHRYERRAALRARWNMSSRSTPTRSLLRGNHGLLTARPSSANQTTGKPSADGAIDCDSETIRRVNHILAAFWPRTAIARWQRLSGTTVLNGRRRLL